MKTVADRRLHDLNTFLTSILSMAPEIAEVRFTDYSSHKILDWNNIRVIRVNRVIRNELQEKHFPEFRSVR